MCVYARTRRGSGPVSRGRGGRSRQSRPGGCPGSPRLRPGAEGRAEPLPVKDAMPPPHPVAPNGRPQRPPRARSPSRAALPQPPPGREAGRAPPPAPPRCAGCRGCAEATTSLSSSFLLRTLCVCVYLCVCVVCVCATRPPHSGGSSFPPPHPSLLFPPPPPRRPPQRGETRQGRGKPHRRCHDRHRRLGWAGRAAPRSPPSSSSGRGHPPPPAAQGRGQRMASGRRGRGRGARPARRPPRPAVPYRSTSRPGAETYTYRTGAGQEAFGEDARARRACVYYMY